MDVMKPLAPPRFDNVSRSQFRRHFQPSRIVLAVLPAPTRSGVNVITICFVMHCSYRPRMLAIAVQDNNASHRWFEAASEFVLSVPGPSMLDATLYCGTHSGGAVDKVSELGLQLTASAKVSVPGLQDAIGNIELSVVERLRTGDHLMVVGKVEQFTLNRLRQAELPLISVGPDTRGYRVLAHQGQHRIATVDGGESPGGIDDVI